jgi:hypothetical protein
LFGGCLGLNLRRSKERNNPNLALLQKFGLASIMPLQNRVTPKGDILALSERGLLMGNRGILHDKNQRLGLSRWRHPHWIICVLSFKDWHRKVMQQGAYTELFFLDEPTALAAGHRPCALCQRSNYVAFQNALKQALHLTDPLRANDLDRMLHAARIEGGTRRQRRFRASLGDLPAGSMVILSNDDATDQTDDVWLVADHHLLRWNPGGYEEAVEKPDGLTVTVLTPRPTLMALQQGYRPLFHPSVQTLIGDTR